MHKPVLTKEVLQYLNPKAGENFIDCTVGEGGHALEILKINGPSGKLLGIDLDKSQIERSKNNLSKYKDRITLVESSYKNIREIVKENNFYPVNGILIDLGFSSRHVDDSGRGFSFRLDEPLDMRYNIESDLTAEKIINEYSEEEIEKILKDFGEEKFSRQIARNIVKARHLKNIKSTFELKNIIENSLPKRMQFGRINPSTRSFQALRIAVNGELDSLKSFLPDAVEVLEKDCRLVVISFHSLEDRIVKNFFNENKNSKVKILTKKPIIASNEEIIINPRARSAKLRAAIK